MLQIVCYCFIIRDGWMKDRGQGSGFRVQGAEDGRQRTEWKQDSGESTKKGREECVAPNIP